MCILSLWLHLVFHCNEVLFTTDKHCFRIQLHFCCCCCCQFRPNFGVSSSDTWFEMLFHTLIKRMPNWMNANTHKLNFTNIQRQPKNVWCLHQIFVLLFHIKDQQPIAFDKKRKYAYWHAYCTMHIAVKDINKSNLFFFLI